MKKVRNTTFMLSVFTMILYRNSLTFFGVVAIILVCLVAAVLIVSISEVMKIDKQIAKDNNQQFLNPKKTTMSETKDSLHG